MTATRLIRRVSARAAVLLVATALAGAACDVNIGNGGFNFGLAHGKAQDEWTRSYELAPGGTVSLKNINGRVEVEAGDGARVEVRVTRIAKARSDESAREVLKKIEIVDDARPDRVRVETKLAARILGGSHEVRYEVRVPHAARVEASTTNGGVTIGGVEGGLVAASTNGGVVARRIAGDVEASTTNGGVDVDMDSLGSRVKLETVNGGVRLRLPVNAKATISARCLNGGIAIEGLELESAEKSRRRVEGRLNGGGAQIDVETTNGGIRITGKSPVATTESRN